jgi:hypothetical protein
VQQADQREVRSRDSQAFGMILQDSRMLCLSYDERIVLLPCTLAPFCLRRAWPKKLQILLVELSLLR